jgi:hypothetical protein
LLVPVGALFAAAIVSRLNIGYRHVLAALPFLLVLASTAVLFLRRQPAGRFALGLILSWMVFSAVWQNPHHLAYFNEALGGMAEGYHYLGDSNLDWGQDIKLLAETIAGEEEGWWVSYYGANDPAYYGLAEEALFAFDEGRAYFAAANPPAGKYAVSANHLQGQLPDADFLDWFRHEEPADQLGGSILIYEIEEQARGDWIAHCLDPAPLLTVEEAETLLGRRQLRHLYFDCRQSFVLAAGGAPGWVVLPQSDSWWFGEQWPAVREGLELVYRHDGIPGLPSFDIVYWPGLDGARLTKGWKQVGEQAGKVVTLPRALNRVVRLAGYQFEGKQWLTLWSISAPTREALSLQAHYFTEAAAGPYIGDSLGFSSEQWQTGDWLLQRFVFPEAEEGLYLETGLYNFQTLEEVGETINLAAEQRQR